MKPISLIISIIFAFLAHNLVAQQHCNNLLLDFFHFQPLNSPQPGTGIPYCHHLKSALTCCSVETVASFQTRADRILDKINNYNAARDLYLAQLRFRYYERFIQLLNNITENHKGDLEEIRGINATFGDQLKADIISFKLAKDVAQDIQAQFVKALYEYQQARTKCLTTALQIRSSAWCMACDPNYQNEGLNDDGSVSFSDSLCQTISNDCWDYFDKGAKFNGLFKVREVYWKLLKVSEYLDNYPYGNATKLNDPDPYKPLSTQHTVTVPDRWTSADGNCGAFWAGDSQLSKILAFGTVTSGAEQASAGIVAEEEANIDIALIEPGGRMLYGLFHLIEDLTDPDVDWYVYPDPAYYYGITDNSDLGDLLTFGLGDLFD